MNYLKTALRIQAKYKWFSLLNVLGLSIGITCSLVIFLYVNTHLSTESFHQDENRIYRVVLNIHTLNGDIEFDESSSYPMAKALSDDFSQIEMAAYCMRFYNTPTITITGDGKAEKFKDDNIAAYADNNFIKLFEYNFLAGTKATSLKEPGSVVLSAKQAMKYFGSVDVIGRTLNINNSVEMKVTGVFLDQVKPSDLNFSVLVSLPTLRQLSPKYKFDHFSWIGSNNWTFIKLKNEEYASDVEAQLPAFVEKYLGQDFKHWEFRLQPLRTIHFDTRYDGVIDKTILWILSGVGLALILIVCVNYVNLAIAQSNHRSREIGVRKCLGANKSHLFGQFMSETAITVFMSLAVSLLLCYLMLPLINVWMQLDLKLNRLLTSENLTFVFVSVAVLILLAGFYPAIILSGFNPINAMNRKPGGGNSNQLVRKVLVSFQYVIALVFLISTLVIVQQVDFFINNTAGFSKDGIITVNLPRKNLSMLRSFSNEVATIPGVEAVTMHHEGPMSAAIDGGFITYDNRTQFEDFIVRDRWGDESFIKVYSMQLVSGRNIVLHDSTTEVLVNQTLMKSLGILDPQEILGRSILFDNSAIKGTVVGVVGDFHHRSLQSEIEPLAIYPFPGIFNQLGVKVQSGKNITTIKEIDLKWKNSFPDEVFTFDFLDETVAKMYHVETVTGKLMQIFAAVSIVICSIGILGLSIFSALQRRKEIGIRKVMGASVWNILMLLSKQYLFLTTGALAVAIPIAFFLMDNWLQSFAYHIKLSWIIFAVPALLMILATLGLVGGQTLKTALTNPTDSLKHE